MRISKSERDAQRQEAIKFLHDVCPQGSTVYTVLTNVSRSGMSRSIKCLIVSLDRVPVTEEKHDGKTKYEYSRDIIDIGYHVSRVLDYSLDKRNEWSVKVSGCGMDMGFYLVTQLSYALGYNNDENGRITGSPVEGTNAYGLNHKWL